MTDRNTTPEFERLLEHLKQSRGFEFTAYKRSTLSRRIDKRLAAVGVGSYPEYLDYLEVHPDEFDQLFDAILINVTSFFRDVEMFDYLRGVVIPAILRAKPGEEPVRVWSAGCASGEECCSIAMLFAEALGSDFSRRVKIYATDVDEDALAAARQASYTERQVASVPPDLLAKYFDHAGGRWTFKKECRRSVIFGRHNLLDDAPISRVDLLVCRNTLMYFNQEAQAKIATRFHYALRDDAYLVLGRAEMLLAGAGLFTPLDLKHRVFTKVAASAGDEALLRVPAARDERPRATGNAGRLREIAFDQDPIAQIVLDEQTTVLLANTCARDLFGLSSRDVGRRLQDLELSYRPAELRSCVADAHARRQVVQLREIAWPSAGGQSRYFTVQVTPIIEDDRSLGTKILFIDVTREHDLQEEVLRSRQDIETAYEELQSTNEELETTNEELQSTVEELETTNEELQSTNEELETMNEELQSTNEELETVNEELRARGIDLARSNAFLSGILRSVPLAVIVMNDDLLVELWNDTAADMWGLRQDEVRGKNFFGLDIGLPVHELRQPLLMLRQSPDRAVDTTLEATNRRGRPMRVRVSCAAAGGPNDGGRGFILLIQEAEAAQSTRSAIM